MAEGFHLRLTMAAPADPLPRHHFQHPHSSSKPKPNPNPNASPTASPWGTWEELLLGSAVLKHGANNWGLVSQELQSRARASFSFTPEACRAGYHAIQLRFGGDAGRGGGGGPLQWYEELRRLRVAHLRRELEQYDSSIGSLEIKIKRLQSEGQEIAKAQSSHVEAGGSESNEAPSEPGIRGAGHAGEGMLSVQDEADGSSSPEETTSDAPNVSTQRPTDPMLDLSLRASYAQKNQSNGLKNRVNDGSTGSLIRHHDADKTHIRKQDGGPASSNSTLYLSFSKSDSSSKEQEKLSHPLLSFDRTKDGGHVEGTSSELELPLRSPNAPDRNAGISHGNLFHLPITDTKGEALEDGTQTRHVLPALHNNAFVKGDEVPQGKTSSKVEALPSLKSANIEEPKRVIKPPYGEDDDAKKNSDDDSHSLCSPRLKSQPAKRRRNIDGSASGLAWEVGAQDDVDDKHHVRKALDEKHFIETMSNRPVESADSTEGKGQQGLAIKALNPNGLSVKVKKEVKTCKEVNETLLGSTPGRDDKNRSRKAVVGAINTDKQVQSTSSTENSLHCEVWGESAEVLNKELKPTQKRRRLLGKVHQKHKLGDTDDLLINLTPRASLVKTELLTASHEASESMQSPGGKEEPDREGWNQGERLSGDSQYEKSEVGSYVDGNEDLSPMSRRNRREPKVSGKLIPLLESLRAICAHKCGHFFRHNHEAETDRYIQIVRVPIDLGMIRTRLEEGHYSGSMHFFRDLLLMVSNAMVYYPKDSSEGIAAFALRECILKEMVHVFETEALVKQEGPSFRKRDFKHILGGQGRRKGGFISSSMDRMSGERECVLKQSDANNGVESGSLSHQSLTTRVIEGVGGLDKSLDGKKSAHSFVDFRKIAGTSAANKASRNKMSKSSLNSELGKANEVKEGFDATPGEIHERKEMTSDRSPLHTTKNVTFNGGMSENAMEKRAGLLNAGSAGKASVWASHKVKETGKFKANAVPAMGQEPVKRGVGRPPKHAQQGLPKPRDVVDASIRTRKRSRR